MELKPRESDKEIESRLKTAERSALFAEWRTALITGAVALTIVVVVFGCVYVLCGASQSQIHATGYTSDDKKIAAGLISSIIAALFGYLAGMNKSSK